MRITDIQNMPDFNPVVKNGIDSVTQGKVYLVEYPSGYYPHCRAHGAINKVSPDGIWRCIECNEGCYELK